MARGNKKGVCVDDPQDELERGTLLPDMRDPSARF